MNRRKSPVPSKGKIFTAYVGLYITTYLAIGVMVPLIGQYLDSLGFSGFQIGVVTGTGTCVAIFASGFWGRIYANCVKKPLLIGFLCIAAACAAFFITGITEYFFFLIFFALMYFFQAPIMPLSDALAMGLGRATGQSFGTLRMWGAVGFAVGILMAATVADKVGLGIVFPVYAFCYIGAAFMVYSLYRISWRENLFSFQGDERRGRVKEEKIGGKPRYRDFLGNRRLWALIASAFFLCGTNVANNTYFGFLYLDGGGTLAGVGVAFFLMAGSEAPFMAWTEKISSRFTMEKVILFAMVLSVARFTWYGTGPNYGLLLAGFFLQGAVNGIILVEFVRYISKLVAERHIGVAIAAYYSISSSGSTIICQLIGGKMLDLFGASGVYFFFALFNGIGLILYLLFGLHKEGGRNGSAVDNVNRKYILDEEIKNTDDKRDKK